MTEFQKWLFNVAGLTVLVLAVLILWTATSHPYPWPFPLADIPRKGG